MRPFSSELPIEYGLIAIIIVFASGEMPEYVRIRLDVDAPQSYFRFLTLGWHTLLDVLAHQPLHHS